MNYIQAYYTDIGTMRQRNEDSLAILKANTTFGEVLLAVVCDGMGGHSNGELASKHCVQRFVRWFHEELPQLLYEGLKEERLKTLWSGMVAEVNRDLVAFGTHNGVELGSTLTAMLFCQERYYVAHVGDSRAYEIAPEGTHQITKDQSYLAQRVEMGLMTQEEADSGAHKNYLIECVGITSRVNMLFWSGIVQKNAAYLMCTDGFWHLLAKGELERYFSASVAKSNKTVRMHLNYLVEQMKNRGERDNISAIAVIPYRSDIGNWEE